MAGQGLVLLVTTVRPANVVALFLVCIATIKCIFYPYFSLENGSKRFISLFNKNVTSTVIFSLAVVKSTNYALNKIT